MTPFLPALLLAFPFPQEPARPGALELVDDARAFVPSFEGDTKDFLSASEERDVRVARALLEAARLLDPEDAWAAWWQGRCEALLADDARHRGHLAEADERLSEAVGAFDHALALDPAYYWAHYGRAMALARGDRFWRALASFDAALAATDEAIAAAPDEEAALDPRFVRFKALLWRADTRMRTLEHELAREEFRAFYAENGDNRWDLGYSLAETYLHERDLGGARATWEGLLENPEYVPWSSTYEQLGYLAGLVGRAEEGVAWLTRSFEHELSPGLYPRLWLFLLASGEARERARADLDEFVRHPPADLSDWDRRLGAFVLGGEDVAAFLARAEEEAERRRSEGLSLDDLPCEAWFYAGVRHEADGRPFEALEAWRRALSFRPRSSKWELEYARLRFARLAAERGLAAAPGFRVSGSALTLAEDAPLNAAERVRGGTIERLVRHVPGDETSRTGGPELAADPPRPGELWQLVVRSSDGERHAVLLLVDAR